MFSGIIEELGQVKRIERHSKVTLFEINSSVAAEGTKIGDSISVNGACLTVIGVKKFILSFEVIPETLKITNLGLLKIGDKVNLERALKVGERISGHFVTGHIDCQGIIRRKNYLNDNLAFEIAVPERLLSNILLKGSVAVDGISLTVMAKKSGTFLVYIIPHTFKNTTLGFKGHSDKVNIEFDILVKKGA